MTNQIQAPAPKKMTAPVIELFYFIVKIIICSCGYEKDSVTIVRAATKGEAKTTALTGEAHNKLLIGKDGWFDEDDRSFSYFVKSAVKISQEDAAVFIKHQI